MAGPGDGAPEEIVDHRFLEEAGGAERDRRGDPHQAGQERERESPERKQAAEFAEATLPRQVRGDREQRHDQADGSLGEHRERERSVEPHQIATARAELGLPDPEGAGAARQA